MAQVEVLNIDTKLAQKSLKDLRNELKSIKDEMANLEEGSDAFVQAANRAGTLKHQIDEINDSVRGASADFGDMLSNSIVVTNGIIGGFTAAQGALNLFGLESEEVTKAIKSLQGAMAIGQGLTQIDAMTKALPKLQKAITSTTTSAKLLKAVLQPKVILLLTAAITALVLLWKRFGDSIEKAIPVIGKIKSAFSDTTTVVNEHKDAINQLTTEINNYYKTQEDNERNAKIAKLNEDAKKQYDDITKAVEEATIEIKKLQKEQLEAADNNNLSVEKQRDIWNTAAQKISDLAVEINKLKKQQEDLINNTDNYRKSTDEATKSTDKWAEATKQIGIAYAKLDLQAAQNDSYESSKEYSLKKIELKEKELKLTENLYGKESEQYIKQQTELVKLRKEYEETFLIYNKLPTLGEGITNVEKFINYLRGNFVEINKFSGTGIINAETLKVDLGEIIKFLYTIGNQLQSGIISFDDLINTEGFSMLEDNIKKVLKNVKSYLDEGIIDLKLYNYEIGGLASAYATYLSGILTTFYNNENFKEEDIISTINSNLEAAADIFDDYFVDSRTKYEFTIQFLSEISKRTGINVNDTIAYYGRLIEELDALEQKAKDLVNAIITEGTAPLLAQQQQFDEEQQILDAALKEKLISYEEYNAAIIQLSKDRKQFEINNTMEAAQGVSSILSNLADTMDENNEKQFNASKALKISSATIDMLAGIVSALSGLWTTKTGPWDIALAAIQATAIATSGAANIAKISRQKYNGGTQSPTVSSSAAASTILPPTQLTQAVQNANIEQKLGDNRVFVTETDISNTQSRVRVQESENTY